MNRFELEDWVFYTILYCLDDNNKITSSKRIGIISEIPQKVFDAVYPFKSVQLKYKSVNKIINNIRRFKLWDS